MEAFAFHCEFAYKALNTCFIEAFNKPCYAPSHEITAAFSLDVLPDESLVCYSFSETAPYILHNSFICSSSPCIYIVYI